MTKEEYLSTHSLNEAFTKKIFLWDFGPDKITIPVFDDIGITAFNRYRHFSGPAKFSADTGSHPTLYPAHLIKKQETVVLCEGEPDCVRLWQEKIPAVTGTSGVKTFSPKITEPLKGKRVLITLDTDEEGQGSVEKYFKVLTETGATPFIIDLPPQFKDVSEYFTAGHTKADFDQLTRYCTLEDWQDAHEPEEYNFEEGPAILARDLPPEEWLVDRILPTEGFAFIIGPEATAKSFFALTLAQAVATKTAWLKQFKANKQEKVLIIDKENTKRRVQSRMKGLSMTGENIFWLKYPHYFELTDDSSEDGFSKIAKSAARKVKTNKIKFIIIDSFTDVMIGNENAAGDVQKFFDAMRQLFPGCCILVLHHASKPAPGLTRTSAQRTRGSTNIMAQVYSAFFVEALPKSKKEFTLEQTKAGDAEKLNKFLVELAVEPVGEEGKTKVAEILYKGEVQDAEAKLAEAELVIEEAFKSTSSIARKDFLDMAQSEGISQRTADRAIKAMIDEEKVEAGQDPNNRSKKIYYWKGERAEIYGEND